MTSAENITIKAYSMQSRAFLVALGFNALWINLSEILRYFGLVKPMLNGAFPDDPSIAAVTPSIFLSWMVWDTILVVAATAYYWLHLERAGVSKRQALLAASCFTVVVFGLLWLGVINMGLAPLHFMLAALPLAWVEQIIAAFIVYAVLKRHITTR